MSHSSHMPMRCNSSVIAVTIGFTLTILVSVSRLFQQKNYVFAVLKIRFRHVIPIPARAVSVCVPMASCVIPITTPAVSAIPIPPINHRSRLICQLLILKGPDGPFSHFFPKPRVPANIGVPRIRTDLWPVRSSKHPICLFDHGHSLLYRVSTI